MARQPLPQLSGPEALSPSARPVDTYVVPGQAASPLNDALKALSVFSPKLQEAADRANQSAIEEQQALAERKIGGMTYEEAKQAVTRGDLHEFGSPWFRAAFEKQFGIRAAGEMRRHAEEAIATQDMTEVDPDRFTADLMKQYQADLPQGRFATSGFNQTAAQVADMVRQKVNSDRVANTVKLRDENAFQNMQDLVEQGRSNGDPPAKIAADVRDAMKGNRDTLGMSYEAQYNTLARVVQVLGQQPGNEEVIGALGQVDRNKGVSLATHMGTAFLAAKESSKAETLKADNEGLQKGLQDYIIASRTGDPSQFDEKGFLAWAEQHPSIKGATAAGVVDAFRSAQEANLRRAQAQLDEHAKQNALIALDPKLNELARTGHIAEAGKDVTWTTASGKEVTISHDELMQRGLTNAADALVQEGQAQKLDPMTIRQNVIRMYGSNGAVDPLVQSRVSALLNASVRDGDVPQTVLDYLPELAATERAAPGMKDRVATSERDRKFLDALTVGMDYGLSPQEAVHNAVYRRDNADRFVPMPAKDRQKMTADALAKLQGGIMGFGKQEFGNTALMTKTVQERLDYFYETGAHGGDLLKRAVESVQRTHAYLNGQLIDVSGTGLSGPAAVPILREASDAVAEAKRTKGPVSWVPMGHGSTAFQAVVGGEPLKGTTRTWAELMDLYQARRSARLQQHADTATARSKANVEYAPTGALAGGAPGSLIEPSH